MKKSQSRHCCTFKSLETDNSDGDIYDGLIEVKTRQGLLTDCDIITTAVLVSFLCNNVIGSDNNINFLMCATVPVEPFF